jgi:hypothetical protein
VPSEEQEKFELAWNDAFVNLGTECFIDRGVTDQRFAKIVFEFLDG